MMPSRTTQPYRSGARRPSGALTAMLRGTTAYGGNPGRDRQDRLAAFGQAHQRYSTNSPRPHPTTPYSTDRPRPHAAGNPGGLDAQFGAQVRQLAQAGGRTGGIGDQVRWMAQAQQDVHPDVIQAQLDDIRRRLGGRR